MAAKQQANISVRGDKVVLETDNTELVMTGTLAKALGDSLFKSGCLAIQKHEALNGEVTGQ